MNRDSFSKYHPVVNFVYLISVIIFSMFFLHPVLQIVSYLCALIYSIMLKGKKSIKVSICYMLPIMILVALINPAFNHEGATILFYLKNGNPITLESIFYGIATALMLMTVITWFSCYNEIMTSDKFIYLFGNLIPSLSLIFSMVLRFVPRYKAQIKNISNAQKGIGKDVSQGNIIKRTRNGLNILSITTSWALENAIETSDSMKSRGYGMKKRTAFSIYFYTTSDKIVLFIMMILICVTLLGGYLGYNTFSYFPYVKYNNIDLKGIIAYIAYFSLCAIPIVINVIEEIKWKYFI